MNAKVYAYRGSSIESQHDFDYVIMQDQKVIASSENVEQNIFPRSSIKLLQAFDFVISGAADHYHTNEERIVLACASHNSEEKHVHAVKQWMNEFELNDHDLICGPAYPRLETDFIDFIKSGQSISHAHNNCSGKHTAMLLNSKYLKLDMKDYANSHGEIQKRFLSHLEVLCNKSFQSPEYGIDGCGLPNYKMSLMDMATAMQNFLQWSKQESSEGLACKKIITAIQNHPYMLAGRKRLCTEIVSATKARILAKVGAEGSYTAMVLDENISISLKVRDGSFRAVEPALVGLLNHYGLLKENEKETLKNWLHFPIYNTLNHKVGYIESNIS